MAWWNEPMTAFSKLHATGNDFLVTTHARRRGRRRRALRPLHGRGCRRCAAARAGYRRRRCHDDAHQRRRLDRRDERQRRALPRVGGPPRRGWEHPRGSWSTPAAVGARSTSPLDASGDVVHAVCDMGSVTFDPACVPVTDATGEGVTADGRRADLPRRRRRHRQPPLGDRGRRTRRPSTSDASARCWSTTPASRPGSTWSSWSSRRRTACACGCGSAVRARRSRAGPARAPRSRSCIGAGPPVPTCRSWCRGCARRRGGRHRPARRSRRPRVRRRRRPRCVA